MAQKTIKITEGELSELRENFPKIGTVAEPCSEYEIYRGKIDATTLVVYRGKRGITLQLQNTTRDVEDKIRGIIPISEERKIKPEIRQGTLEKPEIRQRIIEIDDTGWGDLIGGVFIVGRDVKTDRCISREIPAKFFQVPYFAQKTYYKETVRCVEEILDEFNAKSGNTSIRICTGVIFSGVYPFLERLGYSYGRAKITGKTQDLAEDTFNKYLSKIGCPRGYRQMRKWLDEDYEGRVRYAKTGWKEFRNISSNIKNLKNESKTRPMGKQ